jgi:hypothetical protein
MSILTPCPWAGPAGAMATPPGAHTGGVVVAAHAGRGPRRIEAHADAILHLDREIVV